MITSGHASDRSRCTSPLIAAVPAFLLLLTVASHYGASSLTERATFLPQPDGHLLFQTEDVDRIAIRWEDCGVDSVAVSRAVLDAAWATEDPLDDEVPPQRYAGRVVDVAVLHTATGAAVDPPLTLPLGYNMSVVLTIDLPTGAPNGTYFEEQTIGFPFSATGSSCEPGEATLPMGAGGTWGAGFHCPLPPGRHQSVVTVVTPRELPIPWYIDISALEVGFSTSTFGPSGAPLYCLRQMFSYVRRPPSPNPPPPPPPPLLGRKQAPLPRQAGRVRASPRRRRRRLVVSERVGRLVGWRCA
mmetsp:Transcript_43498/g.141069  ORF Transcript_43498/g.141069 Transcript_43498/m.141069 type:complete len:300 (-) Transcript_43498:229-1128(-)